MELIIKIFMISKYKQADNAIYLSETFYRNSVKLNSDKQMF